MSYTEVQIQKMLTTIGQLYKAGCLNYRGKADSGRNYQEVCAEYLLSSGLVTQLCNANLKIKREKGYKVGHSGLIKPITNRYEEHLAKIIVNTFKDVKNESRKPLGRMLDYQVPLKNSLEDDAGKIDLISYDGKTLFLIELKRGDSTETLLRCIMEISTYAQILDSVELLTNFGLPADTKIQKIVLFPAENKKLSEDCKLAASGAMPKLEELRKQLQVDVCVLEWNGTDFSAELNATANGKTATIAENPIPGLYSFTEAAIIQKLTWCLG